MKLFQHICPRCKRALAPRPLVRNVICRHCGATLAMKPDFLSSFSGYALFVSGALLVGSETSDMLHVIGFKQYSVGRILIDLALGAAYYGICRTLFSLFQRPQATATQQESHRKSH